MNIKKNLMLTIAIGSLNFGNLFGCLMSLEDAIERSDVQWTKIRLTQSDAEQRLINIDYYQERAEEILKKRKDESAAECWSKKKFSRGVVKLGFSILTFLNTYYFPPEKDDSWELSLAKGGTIGSGFWIGLDGICDIIGNKQEIEKPYHRAIIIKQLLEDYQKSFKKETYFRCPISIR